MVMYLVNRMEDYRFQQPQDIMSWINRNQFFNIMLKGVPHASSYQLEVSNSSCYPGFG